MTSGIRGTQEGFEKSSSENELSESLNLTKKDDDVSCARIRSDVQTLYFEELKILQYGVDGRQDTPPVDGQYVCTRDGHATTIQCEEIKIESDCGGLGFISGPQACCYDMKLDEAHQFWNSAVAGLAKGLGDVVKGVGDVVQQVTGLVPPAPQPEDLETALSRLEERCAAAAPLCDPAAIAQVRADISPSFNQLNGFEKTVVVSVLNGILPQGWQSLMQVSESTESKKMNTRELVEKEMNTEVSESTESKNMNTRELVEKEMNTVVLKGEQKIGFKEILVIIFYLPGLLLKATQNDRRNAAYSNYRGSAISLDDLRKNFCGAGWCK